MGGSTGFVDRLELGTLSLSLDVAFTYATASHGVDPADFEVQLGPEEQPDSHEIASWLLGFQATAAFGLGNRLGVEARLPMRVSVIRADFYDQAGSALQVESIHHRDETVAGIGDLALALLVGAVRPMDVPGLSVDLRLGLSFPTGHVEDDPYSLGRQGLAHKHTFFGAGAFLPQLGVSLALATPSGSLTMGLDGQLSLYDGEKGYRAPSQATFGVGWRTGFGVAGFAMHFKHDLYVESPAYWNGERAENSGRTDLLLSVGASGEVGGGVSLSGLVRVPYVTLTEGGQYDAPVFLGFSISWVRDLID